MGRIQVPYGEPERCVMIDRAGVPRETTFRLHEYWDLLTRWNRSVNLVSKRGIEDGFARHVVDAVQLAPMLPSVSLVVTDLGSGGGIPGVPLAIVRRGSGMKDTHNLIESDARKAAFLQVVSGALDLRLNVILGRSESIEPTSSHVVTSRAMAPVVALMPHLCRHLRPEGVGLLHKGRNVGYELETAGRRWSFRSDVVPSTTSDDGVILRVASVRPRSGD